MIEIKETTLEKIERMVQEQADKLVFKPLPIERDLLLERVSWKDWSGIFLGKAFVSMYRSGTSAVLNLTDTCNLDTDGTRLLFQIIFARNVSGWSDQYLYEIEQEIIEILNLKTDSNGVIKPIMEK